MAKKKTSGNEIEIPIGKIGKIINKKIKEVTKNPYVVLSVTLALIIAYLLFIGNPIPTVEGTDIVTLETAAQNVVTFAANQGADATIVSSREYGELYEITLSISGEEVPVYTTKDGKNLIPSLVPINN